MGAHSRALVLSFLFLSVGLFHARGGDNPKTAESLQAELQGVRQQIEEARTNLAAQGKALWKQQHDLEYADPECAQLREEIKALESQIIEKRSQLDARLKTKEPIRAIDDQRRQLVETLRALIEKEKLILNEITALDSPERSRQETGEPFVEPKK
jgi:septal ring factor EnvC (AmiA/AmiB activator)